METYYYYYKTAYGYFSILPKKSGFELWIKTQTQEENLGFYNTAVGAADDVYLGQTGFSPWDLQPNINEPADLSKWHRATFK